MTRKRLLSIALVALILIASAGLASADVIKTVVLTVPDLCASTMSDADAALTGLDGVDGVEFNITDYTITVQYVEYEVGVDDFKRALEALDLVVTEAVEQ
jgi:hypothetical protein